ncbi:hypothetical protein [Candidatus Igneacidithiobacillus taiwanensis]|uniref:hypothetical protein n=1 Tax=Candidatus Igneacidithiobacillus taiwanensis TaxID=1945924 RepID=UPI00289A47DD|nr:hypothetical protein [Candidatus Igneacidithiobacillus taiwanensis]
MHHKRHRPKSTRAGCLLCKPQKRQGVNDESKVYHSGFGKIRRLSQAKAHENEINFLKAEAAGLKVLLTEAERYGDIVGKLQYRERLEAIADEIKRLSAHKEISGG